MAEEKRRRGRPRAEVKATERVDLYFTEEEKAAMKAKANQQGFKQLARWLKHLAAAA